MHRLTDDERDWLEENVPFLSPPYLDLLRGFRPEPKEVTITQEGGDLNIVIEGPWYRTVLWEVPLMATISELYFLETGAQAQINDRVETQTQCYESQTY